MQSDELNRLRSWLQGNRPSELLLAADLTMTILEQSDDGSGFPEAMRQRIRQLLDRGLGLLVCSGDSTEIIRQQFMDHLAYRGPGSYFVAGGGGTEIGVDEPVPTGRRYRVLQSLPPVDVAIRERLLDRTLEVFGELLGQPVTLTEDERQRLLTMEGFRLDIQDRIPGLNEELLLEAGAKGFTVFLRQSKRASGLGLRLLQSLEADPRFRAICAEGKLFGSRGPNFYDAVQSHKGMACAAFFATDAGKPHANRRACVAGDSVNDIPLFRYFQGRDALRIFVGAEEEYEPVTGGGESTLFLGGNLEGTMRLLDEVLRL